MKLSLRWRRRLIICTSIVAAYAIIGFFVVPPIARSQVEKRATAALHRPVKVAKVRCNPFVLSIAIEGLQVTDHDGAELASWERLYVNFDPLVSLFRWQWQIGEMQVQRPRERVVIRQDGALNIADLFPAAPAAPAATSEPAAAAKSALPRVGIGLLRIERGEIEFIDESRHTAFRTIVGPFSYELRDFSTKPGREAPYSFTGSTDTTERFAWTGMISAAPPGSKGRIEIHQTSLLPHMPFFEKFFAGTIQDGRVSVVLNYELKFDGAFTARISDATITVDQLGLRLRDATEDTVGWQKLEIQIAQADLIARTAEVSRVALTGFDGHAQRLADGSIDLLALLLKTSSPTDESRADPGPAASVHVAAIALIDGRVRVTDHTTPRPGTIILDQINATATNAGTDLDREIKLDAQARWCGSGTLAANGVVRLRPLAAALDLQGTSITLRPLETWIEPLANLRIASGTGQFRSHVDLAQPPDGLLALTWTGDDSIENLVVNDGATGGELLGWKSLTNSKTRFNLDPFELSVGEIALDAPTIHVAVDEAGDLNIGYVFAPSAVAAAAPASALPSTTALAGAKASEVFGAATHQSLPFAAQIDAITITDGRFTFTDRSVPGGFTTELRDFGGSIRGLSSTELARADVDLTGSLDGVAPLHVKGSINPLANDRFGDVTVTFSNIDLPLFTAYGGKYLGKKIQKGKLRVDLAYKLSQNSLVAENHVLLDQFYLGEAVASPDAVKLPIGLALALLRDREGKITLDLPVRGNLDDPEFKYGRVVMQVIGNVITKAATAPFAMLGSMFGGRQEDLSYVDFASGSAEFLEATSDKLETLAKALYERPGLRLEISSPLAPDGDRAGLREKRLAELLRAERPGIPAGEALAPIAPEENEALVRSLFARQFPAEAAAAVTATGSLPAPVMAGSEETKKRGLLGRIFDLLFGADEKPAPAPEPSAPEPATDVPPPLTLADMRARLLESIELSDADFQELANARARAIREHLLAGGKIEPERVLLVTEPKVPEGANSATDGGRVFFGLE